MTQAQTQTEPSPRPSSVDIAYLHPYGITSEGWQRFAKLISPAVNRQCEITLMQLLEKAARGDVQMWVLVDENGKESGGLVTKLSIQESGLSCCNVLMASTVDTNLGWESIRNVMGELERFATDQGCDVMRMTGRRGWARLFDDYDPLYVTFEKKLRGVH